MAHRRRAKLYFGSHKDCFLHGLNFNREWIPWLKSSQDNLYLVCVIFPDGFKLITNFSTRPALPSNRDKKSKGLESYEFLEIDPDFAKCLKRNEGEMVVIECIPEVNVCQEVMIAPLESNDYEILECNREKIIYDILDQVRIISSTRPFPVWINNQPVFVKLIKSKPPATWVLLVKNTYVDLQTIDNNSSLSSPYLPSVSPSPRSDGSTSDESQTNSSSQSYFSSLSRSFSKGDLIGQGRRGAGRGTHKRQTSDFSMSDSLSCLPREDSPDSLDDNSGMVSTLGRQILSYLFRAPTSENDQEVNNPSRRNSDDSRLFSPQEENKIFPKHHHMSPNRTYPHPSKPRHAKTSSWHAQTDYERQKEDRLKEISTPSINAMLRVQPVDLSKVGITWGIDQCYDIFVHPSTLPAVYHSASRTSKSYLVCLSLLTTSVKKLKESHSPFVESNVPSSIPTPAIGQEKATLPERPSPEDRGVLKKLVSVLSEAAERGTPSPTLTVSSASPNPQTVEFQVNLCRCVIAHLCFATTVRFNYKRKRSSTICLEEVSVSREGSASPTHGSPPFKQKEPQVAFSVLPGHIVMSDLLRQQLGAKIGSLVLLSEVKESWRVDCRQNRVLLNLHPLSNSKVSSQDNSLKPKLISGFRNWLTMYRTHPFGCVFAENMIVPLDPNWRNNTSILSCTSPDVVLCKVTYKIERDTSFNRKEGGVSEPPIRFFQITLLDLRKDGQNGIEVNPVLGREKKNGVSKEGTESGVTAFGSLPSLEDLGPPKLDIYKKQFGGIDDTLNSCYHEALNLMTQKGGGVMLICGTGGGGMVGGCGKTSLAMLLCKELSESYMKPHVIIKSCTLLRGKRLDNIRKTLNSILMEAIDYRHVVVLLDDLDEVAQNITDIQREAAGEGMANTRVAQVLLNFLSNVKERELNVVVIATAASKQLLHTSLLQSKGKHVFSVVVELPPPDLIKRQKIIETVLQNSDVYSCLSVSDLRTVCLRTEGYQPIDLKVLVDRAISCSEQRCLGPILLAERNFSTVDSSQKKDSIATLVAGSNSLSLATSFSVEVKDFMVAMETYVPASLKGLSLHSGGLINFKHVGGLAAAKQTLQETLLWPSKYPRLFAQCPIRQHAGVLLYGAPGTGKTFLAGAVANEFGLNFVSIKGPELLNKFIGASEQAVRDLFTRAQAARPCILFFDEFDSLAPRRGHDRTGATDRVVNQILTQLDGVETLQGVYVLAASSRPDLIDPALLRPGRIDKILLCDIPSEDERKEILTALTHNLPLSKEANLQDIATRAVSFTGADIKALLYNAQLLAVNRTLEQKQEVINNKLNRSDLSQSGSLLDSDTKLVQPVLRENETGYCKGDVDAEAVVSSSKTKMFGNKKNQSYTNDRVWQYRFVEGDTVQRISPPQTLVEQLVGFNRAPHKSGSDGQKRSECEITHDDLLRALETTNPSLSERERSKYEHIYEKFQGKSKTSVVDMEQRITLA